MSKKNVKKYYCPLKKHIHLQKKCKIYGNIQKRSTS